MMQEFFPLKNIFSRKETVGNTRLQFIFRILFGYLLDQKKQPLSNSNGLLDQLV